MRDVDRRLAAVPIALRTLDQWVVWRYENRAGKATKVPYSPTTRTRASAIEPAGWSTFADAIATWQRESFEGVGFVFSQDDPFCGVDLDDCLNRAGEPTAEAKRILDRLCTYTEISPSGHGLKLFLRARLPAGRRRKGKVEMYDSGRYFTVTGRHLTGTPATIEERQQELEALHAEIFAAPLPRQPARTVAIPSIPDDAQLLGKARSAKNGRKFMDLFYRGDLSAYGGDDSAADLALCCLLAFWCGPDRERIDRLFRRSALMREKWDSRRGLATYGVMTIDTALRRRHG